MEILSIGYKNSDGSDSAVKLPRGLPFYVMLIIETPLIFLINGEEMYSDKNSFIIYEKDVPQYYAAADQPYTCHWCHFNMEEEDRELLTALEIPLNKPIALNNMAEISALIRSIAYEFQSDKPYYLDISELYMKLLFFKLVNQLYMTTTEKGAEHPHYERMQNLRNDIYNNPCFEWTINDMSKRLSMSRSGFQHIYKDIFGVSVLKDIINSRLSRAKHCLITTDMTIAQISRNCGYNSESYFMRQFKEKYGVTPTGFRKTLSL